MRAPKIPFNILLLFCIRCGFSEPLPIREQTTIKMHKERFILSEPTTLICWIKFRFKNIFFLEAITFSVSSIAVVFHISPLQTFVGYGCVGWLYTQYKTEVINFFLFVGASTQLWFNFQFKWATKNTPKTFNIRPNLNDFLRFQFLLRWSNLICYTNCFVKLTR